MADGTNLTDQQFRDGLEEALTVIKGLAHACDDVGDMVGLIELAIGDGRSPGNAAQLKILRTLIFPQQTPQQGRARA